MKFGDHSLSITLAMSKSHSALHYIPHPVRKFDCIISNQVRIEQGSIEGTKG